MNFSEEFELLLRARYPIIYVPTMEEERLEQSIASVAQQQGKRGVYTWDFVDGYQGNPTDEGFGQRNPLQSLELVERLSPTAGAVDIQRDFHRFLDDISVARKLRNLSRILKSQPKTIVLISPRVDIPDDLKDIITVLDFPLPSVSEIQAELTRLLLSTGKVVEGRSMDELVQSCQGLSIERIRRVMARAIATHGELRASDLDLVLEEKRQTIRQTQILDFYPTRETMSVFGGLYILKDWLLRRGGAFAERALQY